MCCHSHSCHSHRCVPNKFRSLPTLLASLTDFHDDAEPWKSDSDGRWYTFASGGNFNRTRGVNILYSISDADFHASGEGWRLEHALWNITSGQCNFVSCPEMYSLPGAPADTPRTSGTVVYESLCGCDQYWLGHYDDGAHTFTPFPSYTVPTAAPSTYCYDYGDGRASKSSGTIGRLGD